MNELINYPVPQWIAILFLVAIPLPFILIAMLVHKEGQKLGHTQAGKVVAAFFVLYITYVVLASLNGLFNQVMLPPKVLLMCTFPYAILLFVIVPQTKAFQSILQSVSLQSLVKLHIFRLIGVFFLLIALHNALPKPFAFIAGLGDMITAITSIYVAKAIKTKRANARSLTYAWNIFGTLDIMFTAICAIVLTKLSIDNGTMGVDTLARFPYCLIPAFAPPTILFLHWCIFKKLKANSSTTSI
jgi:hypothetical protein